jgi:iron(III) transport system permease protein
MLSSVSWRWLRWMPLLALLSLVFFWPLLMLLVGTFRTAPLGIGGVWTAAAWGDTFSSPGTATAIGNSLKLALISTLFATLIAASLAFIAERTDLALRRWITPALMLMFATPALLYAMGYNLLGNPHSGLLNKLLEHIGVARLELDIESWGGLIMVSVLKKVSIIYLFLIGPFRGLNASHDDASLVSGVGQFGTFWRISLPSLAPALSGAVLLGIIGGLQAYEMVLILGAPAGIEVVSMRILDFINVSIPADYARASVLSIVVIAVVALLCVLQARILGNRSFITLGGKSSGHRRLRLQRSRWPLNLLVGGFLVIAVLLPIGAVIFASFQPYPGRYQDFSLQHYIKVLNTPRVLDSLRITLTMAVSVGLSTMLLAVWVAQSLRQLKGCKAAWMRFATLVPMAMPGVVTALAVTWAFVSLPGFKQLYGSLWLVVIALLVGATPFAIQVANAAIVQIAPELQESARISGASATRAMVDVVLRLVAPAFFAGCFMIAIMVVGSLEVPMMLKAPGLNPLAVLIYSMSSTGDYSGASALLILLLLTKIVLWFSGYYLFRLYRKSRQHWHERNLLRLGITEEKTAAVVSLYKGVTT